MPAKKGNTHRALSYDNWLEKFKNKYGDKFEILKVENTKERFVAKYSFITIKCKRHNEIIRKTAWDILNRKTLCPKCAKENRAKGKKYTKEEIENILKERGILDNFEVDLTNFNRIIDEYKFRCKRCGAIKTYKLNWIIYDKTTVKCDNCDSNVNIFLRKLKENIDPEILKWHELPYIEQEYKDMHSEITVRCLKHNYEYKILPQNILESKYMGCKKCTKENELNDRRQYFLQQLKEMHDNKITLLSDIKEYTTAYSKLKFKCNKCGNTWITTPVCVINQKSGCPKCTKKISSYKKRTTKEEFIKKAREKHGNKYDYSKIPEKLTIYDKVTIICPEHGEFEQLAGNHIHNGNGCPKCACVGFSKYEEEIEKFLQELRINEYKTRYKIKDSENNIYEFDIYIPEYNLAIEFHGLFWHSLNKYNVEKWNRLRNIHKIKADIADKLGIRLLQIFEHEWLRKKDIWKSIIKSKLGLISHKIPARKCIVREIDTKMTRRFLEQNHLHGYVNSTIKIGLYCDNELVSVMTFGKHRFKENYKFELYRFANKIDLIVIGGFSKLLKYFVNKYMRHNDILITYGDRRIVSIIDNVYNKYFTYKHKTNPNYWYFNEPRINKIHDIKFFNRLNFQKHKLKNKLPNFDPNKTELENMIILNNYYAIFDAGNLVYELEK